MKTHFEHVYDNDRFVGAALQATVDL